MTDQVEVKLGAQTEDLRSTIAQAAQSVQQSMQQMVEALKGVSTQSKSTEQQAKQSAQSVGGAFGDMQKQIKGHIDGTVSAIEKFKSMALGLAAVFAGGVLWHEAIEGMLHLQSEVVKLENVFGMASDKATTTAIALEILGKSADDLTGIGLKLARQMKNDEENITRLGVATRDASGKVLPLDTIMQNAFETMQTYKAGADQAEFALSVFGRSVSEVYDLMVKLPAAQQRAAELQKELNIQMGPERQAEIAAYKLELGATKVIFSDIADKIGEAVLPSLKGLASWFNDVGPTVVEIFVNAIKGLLIVFDVVATAVRITVENIVWFGKNIVTVMTTIGRIIAAVATGDWNEIPEIWRAGNAKIERETKESQERVVKIYADAKNRIAGLLSDNASGAAGAGPLKSGTRSFVPKPTASGASDSRIGQWQAELAAQRDAYEREKLEQGSFEQFSLAQTSAYWAELLKRHDLTDKERQEISRNYYAAERQIRVEAFGKEIADLEAQKAAYKNNADARIAIAQQEYDKIAQRYGAESKEAAAAYKQIVEERRKMHEQIAKVDDIAEKARTAAAEHGIKMEEIAAAQGVAMHKLSVEQNLKLQADFENRRYQIARDGLLARLRLQEQDPDRDPAKIAATHAAIEALDQAHEEKLTQIENAAVLERNSFLLQAQDAVQGSFATLVDDLVSHTKTLKQSLLDFANSVVSALNKIAAQKIAQSLFGGGSGGADFLSSLLGGAGGGGGGGGGGFDFGSLTGLIPSFAVGTPYVPADTLAMVHKGEGIVPARYNTPGAGGIQQMHVQNHFIVQGAIDSRSQDQIAAAAYRGTSRAVRRTL